MADTLERALARLTKAQTTDRYGDIVVPYTDAVSILTEALVQQESAPAVVDATLTERLQYGMQATRRAPAREVSAPPDDDTPLPLMPTGHYTVKATLTPVGDARERPGRRSDDGRRGFLTRSRCWNARHPCDLGDSVSRGYKPMTTPNYEAKCTCGNGYDPECCNSHGAPALASWCSKQTCGRDDCDHGYCAQFRAAAAALRSLAADNERLRGRVLDEVEARLRREADGKVGRAITLLDLERILHEMRGQ